MCNQIETGNVIGAYDGLLMTKEGKKYGGQAFTLQTYGDDKYKCDGWG